MMFLTAYSARPRVRCAPGSRTKVLYSPVFDKKGVMHLSESGVHNLYAEIQSHKDSVDIHVLLKRYAAGEVDVLSRVQGAYGDFTVAPRTFAEALNAMIAAEQYFLSLPVEVRDKYGHDFNRFIASMDSPDFAADIGIAPPINTLEPSANEKIPLSPTEEPVRPAPGADDKALLPNVSET